MSVATNGSSVLGSSSGSNSITFNVTLPAGTDTLCVDEANVSFSNNALAPTGITYNGAALTKVVGFGAGTYTEASIWRLLAPPTGSSYSLVVTYPSNCDGAMAEAVPLIGVNQTSPTAHANTNSGVYTSPTNPSLSLSGAGGTDLYHAVASAGAALTVGGSQTNLWLENGLNGELNCSGDAMAGSGSGSFTWTVSGGQTWSTCGCSFAAATSSDSIPVPAGSATITGNASNVVAGSASIITPATA